MSVTDRLFTVYNKQAHSPLSYLAENYDLSAKRNDMKRKSADTACALTSISFSWPEHLAPHKGAAYAPEVGGARAYSAGGGCA